MNDCVRFKQNLIKYFEAAKFLYLYQFSEKIYSFHYEFLFLFEFEMRAQAVQLWYKISV